MQRLQAYGHAVAMDSWSQSSTTDGQKTASAPSVQLTLNVGATVVGALDVDIAVGTPEGLDVGLQVGAMVGVVEGTTVGWADGFAEGLEVGFEVGDAAGWFDGAAVVVPGLLVGVEDGALVGGLLGAAE